MILATTRAVIACDGIDDRPCPTTERISAWDTTPDRLWEQLARIGWTREPTDRDEPLPHHPVEALTVLPSGFLHRCFRCSWRLFSRNVAPGGWCRAGRRLVDGAVREEGRRQGWSEAADAFEKWAAVHLSNRGAAIATAIQCFRETIAAASTPHGVPGPTAKEPQA